MSPSKISTFGTNRREQLDVKLAELFQYFRSSMVTRFDASELYRQGVDSSQFDLIDETIRGSTYFQPMSQERVDTLDKRPDFKEIDFDEDNGYPTEADCYMVQDAINDQLHDTKYEAQTVEDIWRAYEFTSWRPVRACCTFERRLREFQHPYTDEAYAPTKQTTWMLLDILATKVGLPHRSCITCGVVRDVTGPTRHELMVLTGLMGVRMTQEAYLKYEVFPVLMLSIYGSRARIVHAHMCPKQVRLQVRYSELFDFRNLTKEWLDIFVRWFLNEPLLGPSQACESHSAEQPDSSDDCDGPLVSVSSKSLAVSGGPRSPEKGGAPQKPLSTPTWKSRCNAEEAKLDQIMARSPTVMDVQ